MDKASLPLARVDDTVVIDLDDETLVYDLARHRAHSLNAIARLVWRLCDGHTTIAHMTTAVASATGMVVTPDIVWYALRRLNGAHLLARPLEPGPTVQPLSRRELVRRVTAAGIGIAVLPAIATIIAPSTLQAQASCLPQGAPCDPSIGLKCCQGLRCQRAGGAGFDTCN